MYFTIISTKTFVIFWQKKRQVLSFKASNQDHEGYWHHNRQRGQSFSSNMFASKHVHMSIPFHGVPPRNFSRLLSFLFGGCLKWITCADYEHEKLQARQPAWYDVTMWHRIQDSCFALSCVFLVAYFLKLFWRMLGWYCRVTCTIPHVYVILLFVCFLYLHIFSDIPNAVPGNYVFIHVSSNCVTVGCWSHI